MPDLGSEFSPAGAVCGYRAPLAPRLARPSRWYRAEDRPRWERIAARLGILRRSLALGGPSVRDRGTRWFSTTTPAKMDGRRGSAGRSMGAKRAQERPRKRPGKQSLAVEQPVTPMRCIGNENFWTPLSREPRLRRGLYGDPSGLDGRPA